MDESTNRVKTLSQALPYIQKFREKTFVIKYGGAAMSESVLKRETIRDFVLLSCVGINVVVVHGGGPEINLMSKKLNLPIKFVDGYRVTDANTMEIVEMVLIGKVQKEIVNLINVSGGKAIGLCGKDGKLFSAKPIIKMKKYGFIGTVESLDTTILLALLDKGFIPVISSVGADSKGQNYNINADDVACSLAKSLKAEKLILLTDTCGVLREKDDPRTLISRLTTKETRELIKKKVIKAGMLPKAQAAIDAIANGVKAVHIIDGRLMHSILLEVFTDSGIGTMILR